MNFKEGASIHMVPPSSPPVAEEAGASDRPTNLLTAKEDLCEEAAGQVLRWELLPKRKRCSILRVKWKEARKSIKRTIREVRHAHSISAPLSDSAHWLLENERFFEIAFRETEDLKKQTESLPQIQGRDERGKRIPRAYAAARSYLQAAGFSFNLVAFETYFDSVQEQAPFEIGELWALRPLVLLLLLEEIALATVRLRQSVVHTSGGRASELNVPVSHLILALRSLADTDWTKVVGCLSDVERALCQDPAGAYARMDFESRNLYWQAIQELARHSQVSEREIAQKAIACSRSAANRSAFKTRLIERRSHVGYYVVDRGRLTLERQIGYRPPFSRQVQKAVQQVPDIFYLVGIEVVTFAIVTFILSGLPPHVPILWAALFLLIPATEPAVGVVNQFVSLLLPPRLLPRLDFSRGIPEDCATVVAIPTLIIDEPQVRQLVRDLEIRYVGNRDRNLHFALLTDSPDSPQPVDECDRLVDLCSELIEDLNGRYRGQRGGGFFHFHRHRVYNPSEGAWMGWERKRGKLLDFNNLLRGKYDSFPVKVGDLSVLSNVRYVITLDADTQLPRDSARRMIATMAHPLNRAIVNPSTNTVVEGYGILQPRVGISVRSAHRSRLANIYSGQTGFDIYTHAVSDVYQDLIGEGSFTGKGIYEVDVFQRVLSGRFPINAVLSHDLIEGAYARAGLISDVELIDDYPSHFIAYSRRKHRWVRGDWQIMRWVLPRVPGPSGNHVPNPISVMSSWKILDNMRRSLLEVATFALLLAGWLFLPGGATRWSVAVLALLLIPSYLRLVLSLARIFRVKNLTGYLGEVGEAFVADQVNVFMLLAFLSHQTLVTVDAIVRTIVRVTITRRKLLEWETTAESELRKCQRTPVDLYLAWTPVVSLVIAGLLAVVHSKALLVAVPVLTLWAFSGPLAEWFNRPMRPAKSNIDKSDEVFLRMSALRTWRYFGTFGEGEARWLIPDNFQEEPSAVAQRISPTNIGLLLNARLAAWSMGYLSLTEFVEDTEKSLSTLRRMSRYHGHFFNWYDLESLEPLNPLLISTVDSGNLACCLWTLKQGCQKLIDGPVFGVQFWEGIQDHLQMIFECAQRPASDHFAGLLAGRLKSWLDRPAKDVSAWIQDLPELERGLSRVQNEFLNGAHQEVSELQFWVGEACSRLAHVRKMTRSLVPWLLPDFRELPEYSQLGISSDVSSLTVAALPELLHSLEARLNSICQDDQAEEKTAAMAESIRSLIPACLREAEDLGQRLKNLGEQAGALVQEMDFGLLYNANRKVLSVGYDVANQHLEKSCYELLGSEARTAAFIAIAKGDVPQESWLHLGRAHARYAGHRVLLSWSGTMFEYLLPALWMRTYPHTILDQTLRAVVRCQRAATKKKHIPWGISESACKHRDSSGIYQYYAFGLRRLAMRPKTYKGLVISAYSSFLALQVDAPNALRNLRSMKKRGWVGPYGFYEAADFTRCNLGNGEEPEVIRSWMAHHQGMILLSICNFLSDSLMQDLFHSEPMVAATERLLHELLPRTVRVDRFEQQEVPET